MRRLEAAGSRVKRKGPPGFAAVFAEGEEALFAADPDGAVA
jgi:hypothetical protein